MSVEALIGFLLAVGLAFNKASEAFDEICKKRKSTVIL